MIESMAQEPDNGLLFSINGIDAPVAWDGLSDHFFPVGMTAPTQALTLGGSGAGQIVGTYYAYVRWMDKYNNPSNLSPISVAYTAQGTTGHITGCTAATPIVVTSPAHGLPTGSWVKISGVGGIDTANNTWQITATDANHFSLDNSSGDGISVYSGGGTWISGVHAIVYTNVQVPNDAKAVRRQILRNTDGEATTFYVDVDTTDLTSTSLSSTLIDSLLQAGTPVPLLDASGFVFANANDKPLSFFRGLSQHLDRMFMCGLLEYNIGSCSVTFGSATVKGAGTSWTTTMAGRFFYVDGASTNYQIASVDTAAQTLTLTDNYADPTDLFAFYSIKPPPAYRRIVAFSQAGLPQSWPLFNQLSMQETGDELTFPMQMGAFVFIVERMHIHKITFADNPLTDGAAFMVGNRGCINQRCAIVIDSEAFLLDELGAYRFHGRSQIEPISDPIQSIFRSDASDVDLRINWRWKEYFHAVLDRQRDTIWWFVCMDGNRYPRHALGYNYKTNRWWVGEYPFPIGGACAGYLGSFTGTPQVYYGAQHGKVYAAWKGTLDVADSSQGTVQGMTTTATAFTLTDATASFSQPLNAPIAITSGTGYGQVRRIVKVDGQTVSVDRPWSITPDSTSGYQIGGVHWLFRSNWLRFAASEAMSQRRFEMLFEPQKSEATAALRFFSDFADEADMQGVTQDSDSGGNVGATAGLTDLTIDMKQPNGLIDRQMPFAKEYFIRGRRYVQYEIEGWTNGDQTRIYQTLLEGALPNGGLNQNAGQ